MIVRKKISPEQPLTPAQVELLTALETRPAIPDTDCPELTDEQLRQFHRVSVPTENP
jgi:hypothetical protein